MKPRVKACIMKAQGAVRARKEADMTFLHISDLHLGKRVFEQSMLAFAGKQVGVMVTEWDMSILPTVSTSANISGEPTPKKFADISDEIKNAVDYTVDPRLEAGATGLASQIIKIGLDGEVEIIRA